MMPWLILLSCGRCPSLTAVELHHGARVSQWGCGVGPSPHQSWRYDIANLTFTVADRWAAAGAQPMCLTAESFSDGAFVAVEPCAAADHDGATAYSHGAAARQKWALDVRNATLGQYVRITPRHAPGLVLATYNFDIRLFNPAAAGAASWWLPQFNSTPLVACTAAVGQTHPGSCYCACSAAQFDANKCSASLPEGAIVNSGTGWCADAGPWDRFPCDPAQPMAQANVTSLPFCNGSLPRAARVADLVARIPDSDLFSLLQTGGVPVISLRIPPWNWWNEALHGVQATSPPINTTTVFPAPLTTAASFNKSLFHLVGTAESVEARAVYNMGGHKLTDWSPNINVRPGVVPLRPVDPVWSVMVRMHVGAQCRYQEHCLVSVYKYYNSYHCFLSCRLCGTLGGAVGLRRQGNVPLLLPGTPSTTLEGCRATPSTTEVRLRAAKAHRGSCALHRA